MAGASSRPSYSSWTMLDNYVRFNYPVPQQGATYVKSKTSSDESIAVLFRAVPPPGASRLYVFMSPRQESLPGRRRIKDFSYVEEPRVVAAHGNSILLQVALSNEFDTPHSDFFIYTIRYTGQGPSLRLLPHCTDTMASEGLSSGLEHMLTPTDIGILCHGNDQYVVADLQVLPEDTDSELCTPLEAQLCILRSGHPSRWEVTRPLIKHKDEEASDLIWWSTDAVVPWGDDLLCYVDYLRGILCADVRSECPQLQYIPLPVKVPSGDPEDPELGTRGCPQLLRRVCVTNYGIVKFVDVVCTTVFVEGCRSPVSSSFTINLWKLTSETMTWEKENDLQDSELWSLPGFKDLPHVVPEFPVINMQEPNLIYFVLSKDGDENVDGGEDGPVDVDDNANAWIITVDILNKTLIDKQRYTKVGGISKYDGEMASRNIAANDVFIQFSNCVSVAETRKRKIQG